VNDDHDIEQPDDREHTRPLVSATPDSGITPPYAGPAYPQPERAPHQQQQQQPQHPPQSLGPQAPYGVGSHSYPGAAQGPRSARAKVSGWVWPAVASLALVLGLVGGAIGGVAVQSWRDARDDGRTSNGINSVDTVSVPPIESGNESVASVAKALLPSTVQVLADYEGQQLGATGSGWVLDKQGHIITNNHVIAGAVDGGDIEVVDHSGHQYTAKLVGRSTVYDIAVLFVPEAKDLQPVSLGSSKAMNVGDPVVAIGSPLGLNETVTSGIISALDRPVTTGESEDETSYINAVQTDAAINPGNSGGPLVSMQGQVIGVNSAIATTGGSSFGGESGNIGVGFAIPIEQVVTTADQILSTGKAQYPVIGAKVLTGGDHSVNGAVIDSVVAGTPADEAGLEKGDVITKVDDVRVSDGQSLIVQIRTHRPGDTITLTFTRDGEEKTADVTLAGEDG